jgi:phage terminase small subunit
MRKGRPSPLLRIAGQMAQVLAEVASELGFTPVAQPRLAVLVSAVDGSASPHDAYRWRSN